LARIVEFSGTGISRKTYAAPPKEILPKRKSFAVVIGLSQYPHAGKSGLTNLPFADDDAGAFRDTLLTLGWDDDHVKWLNIIGGGTMSPKEGTDSKKFFLKSHWWWLFVFVALIVGFSFWQIGEPRRRAKAVYRAVHPGMTPTEVLALPKGRYLCSYRIEMGGELKSYTREEFLKILDRQSRKIPSRGIISITFLGMSPGRFSLQVEFGPEGKVEKVRQPYNWD